jgi:hypothetical protein
MPVFNNALAGASGQGSGGYVIEKSLRFKGGSDASLTRTPTTAGSSSAFTLSTWVKRSLSTTYEYLMWTTTSFYINFTNTDKINIALYAPDGSSWAVIATSQARFRDPSAWYHIVVSLDSSAGTANSDRLKLWVNGKESPLDYTAYWGGLITGNVKDVNTTIEHEIGARNPYPCDFYLADYYWIDGQGLTQNDFGEFDDNNVWQAKEFTGTYGTNGFHLDFSDTSSTAALGFDANVEGTRYSAFVTGFQSSHPPANMFDGSTSTFTLGANSGGIMTFTPGTAIPYAAASGGVELYLHPGSQPDRFRINGGSWVNQTNQATGGWQTISTGDGSITKIEFQDQATSEAVVYAIRVNGTILTDPSGANDWTVNNVNGLGNGTKYRTLELSANHPSGVVSQRDNAFDAARIATYVNTNTWAITNTAWLGSYANGYAEARWIPVGGYAVTSSLRVYFGVYSNVSRRTTLTITYTDGTTESSPQFSSGINNWMTLFTASNAAGKTIQKIEITNPDTTNIQFGGFVIDNVIVESLNVDTDVLRDVPTNGDSSNDTGAGGEVSGNYCTWNPLAEQGSDSITLSNGNLTATVGSTRSSFFGTMALEGKIYWEIVFTGGAYVFGMADASMFNTTANTAPNRFIGETSTSWGIGDDGTVYNNGASQGAETSWTNGDVMGWSYDSSNGAIKIYKNGTLNGSYTASTANTYFPAATLLTSGASVDANFGQRPFAYSAPTGFKALCTTNLPDPTIADGSTAFDAALWTGNGTSQSISGLEFSPDLVWVKGRNAANGHNLQNTISGTGKFLQTHTTSAEGSNTTKITAFNSDGFSLGSNAGVNNNNDTYVGWAWDAGDDANPVSNTDGSQTSQVRANPTAGFSIATFNTPDPSAQFTYGHGLNAAPEFVIHKFTGWNSNWYSYHKSIGQKYINLNDTGAAATNEFTTGPTSSVFTYPSSLIVGPNYPMVAFSFTSVEGYSAFGSYTGNGVTDGPFVYTGFRPAFVLYKRTDSTSDWYLDDYRRDGYNFANKNLYANLSATESSGAFTDFLSNGFKLQTSSSLRNAASGTYIYAAFAEHPFQANGGLAR